MASDIETVARPYAEAAYGYASEQGEVDQWEKMLGFAAAVSADSRVAPLINGTLSADELAAAFCGLLGYDISKEKKTGEPAIDRHCANFLRVMSENGRLSLMPEVFRQFESAPRRTGTFSAWRLSRHPRFLRRISPESGRSPRSTGTARPSSALRSTPHS